jgi:hypothetical protein
MTSKKYYDKYGFYSPAELLQTSLVLSLTDLPFGTLVSTLGVIRTQNDENMELEFIEVLRQFLLKNVPEYGEEEKRGKAKYN